MHEEAKQARATDSRPVGRGMVPARWRAPGAAVAVPERIRRLLRAGVDRYLVTAVVAPAGMGKTSALGSALSGCAWLTVSSVMRDPIRLLGYLEASLTGSAGLWRDVDDLLAWLDAEAGGRVVVLDDAHLLRGSASERLVQELGAGIGGSSRLVVAGRRPACLDRARWLLEGRLVQVGIGDLRMTEAELLPLAGSADAARRCDGWPIAAQLHGLSAHDRADYFEHHVLADLDAPAVADLASSLAPLRAHLDARSSADRPELLITCFGGLRVEAAGHLVPLDSVRPRARDLLRLLAAEAGRPCNREWLVDQLWPERDTAAGVRSLQVAVSALRQLLDQTPGVIARDGPCYRLDVESVRVDVREFQAATAAARAARGNGDPGAAARHAEIALELYRGDCLPEAGPVEWAVEARDRLRQLAVQAATLLSELRLAAGDPEAALCAAERGLELDRFDDASWKLCLRAHELAGGGARLQHCRRAYAEMLTELGVQTRATAS